jgi:hypothetical protein
VSAAAIDNDAVTTRANEALSAALGNLSYRERRVLGLRYGLGGKTPLTLGEVGRTLNVTSERVRQVERESIQKLQQLSESQQLRTDSESHPDSAPPSHRETLIAATPAPGSVFSASWSTSASSRGARRAGPELRSKAKPALALDLASLGEVRAVG